MVEYKVVELKKNEGDTGENLEWMLNGYAQEGWRVVSVLSSLFYGESIYLTTVEGVTVVFERDIRQGGINHEKRK